IGGGDGTLLAAILRENPRLRGILFDTAAGSAESSVRLGDAGVAQRCRVEVGDFFARVPAGAQLYLLKSVVHDWDDDRAATILGHCRSVIPDEGRLLLIEPVPPETVDPEGGPGPYLTDLNMLVNVGGRERTRTDFEALLTRSGFTLTRIRSLPSPQVFQLIEAAPEPI
ncbi:MAG: methyltransferase, partial [Pseudonocardiaceae bacterium]